jgi:tRNA nucleotidyltransferase/poly(A) polymerase
MTDKSDNKIKLLTSQLEEFLGIPLFLVGGAVRDYLLGREVKDWDFTTPSEPDEIEAAIKRAGRRSYAMGKAFGTLAFKYPYQNDYIWVEITTFRQEVYQLGNRKPQVSYTKDLILDLSRRDLTINAMALDSKGEIIDPFNGQIDLKKSIVRAVGNPDERFKEDPLRILRAVRFACQYGFEIEKNTLDYIKTDRFKLLNISKERWIQELDKILVSKGSIHGLELLAQNGIFEVVIPELDFLFRKEYKTSILKEFSENSNLELDQKWALLLKNTGYGILNPEVEQNPDFQLFRKELVSRICTYLKFSGERTKVVLSMT